MGEADLSAPGDGAGSARGSAAEDVALARLSEQQAWYSRRSRTAKDAYLGVKIGQLAVGAAVPVIAALSAPPVVTAVVSALVVVAEGAQQLFQWQTNWISYRTSSEALKHERFLYLAGSGPYSGPDRVDVFAQRIENVVAAEVGGWRARIETPAEAN